MGKLMGPSWMACWWGMMLLALPFVAGNVGAGIPGVPWPATDGLGRHLPLSQEVGGPRADRFVGLFYFLWHDNPQGKSPHHEGPYDITWILARDPGALTNPNSPYWGPIGTYHYWGEPLFGYYRSDDPWVLRRHAQLLVDAGVDALIFDTTNAVTYRETYRRLCEVFAQIRAEGGGTPQIVFMVNTKAGDTAQQIYADLYEPGRFRDLWFLWEGKPLLICDPEQASPELREFFTLRRAHWPFTMVNTANAWHWEATYPQPYGFTTDPNRPEQVNVSVAQNLRREDGKVTNMSSGEARGRSFHQHRVETEPGAVNQGYNFAEQWQRVFELEPPFVMITGWNEWIAGRWGKPGDPLVFVDQFDQEYSRDIEPARVGHLDHYYWQMVANIRRYKGAPPMREPWAARPAGWKGTRQDWAMVEAEYRDHAGETAYRDHPGVAGLHYANRTGRNDFTVLKVAHDASNLHFLARTREPITPSSDPNWMWLLIDADRNPATGWEGYDYRVNGRRPTGSQAWVERNLGGWAWGDPAPVDWRVEGSELVLTVPRAALGLVSGTTEVAVDFKWMDNCQQPGDIMDAYLSGDVAPEGRFRYRYLGSGLYY